MCLYKLVCKLWPTSNSGSIWTVTAGKTRNVFCHRKHPENLFHRGKKKQIYSHQTIRTTIRKCCIIKTSFLPVHCKKNRVLHHDWVKCCTFINRSRETPSRTNTRLAKYLFWITYPALELVRKQHLNNFILADAGFSLFISYLQVRFWTGMDVLGMLREGCGC